MARTTTSSETFDSEHIRCLLGEVYDPELPGITIAELGILRDIDVRPESITVWLTPTWAGCPALDEIKSNVYQVLSECPQKVEVKQKLSPPWTTQWLTQSARDKLQQMNIVPPQAKASGPQVLLAHRIVQCPRCQNKTTRLVSECSSTACKAMYTCPKCQNTFEYFKDI